LARFDKKLAPESKTANQTRSIEAPSTARGSDWAVLMIGLPTPKVYTVDEDTVDAPVL
jgi:hypothetical protein